MLLLASLAFAQDPEEEEGDVGLVIEVPEEEVKTIRLADGPEGLGLGISLGLPTGVSGAWRKDPKWHMSTALAWNVPNRAVTVHVDYHRTVVQIVDENAPNMAFPLTVGIGPKFQSRTSKGNATPVFGLRTPLSLTVIAEDYPVDAFIEIVPVLELYPGTAFNMDAAVGARVWFQ